MGRIQPFGHAFERGIVAQAKVGLDHHGGVVVELLVRFEGDAFCGGFRSPGYSIGAIDFLGDQFHAVAQLHVQRIEIAEVDFFVAGIDHRVGQFQSPVATLGPMLGHGAARAGLLGGLPHHGNLVFGVGLKGVDAHYRIDARFANNADVVQHIRQPIFQQLQIFFGVVVGQSHAQRDFRASAMHFEGADGSGQHGNIGSEPAVAALHVPEFLESDVGGESAFGDMVVEHLQAKTIANDGRLSHGDVGKRAGVHHAWLVFGGGAQRWIDGIAHPGAHGACNFQVAGGHGIAFFIVSQR